MGVTKKHLYTQDQLEIAELFKAMAHPARIAIVQNLLTHENLNCKGLRKYIPLAQSTISQHIKQLHNAGILALNAIDNNAYYVVNLKALDMLALYIQDTSQKVSDKNEKYLFSNAVYQYVIRHSKNNIS